ncbi:MAG: response regulator [Chloroflexota bacterium]|nr:response regulator [Chloroflexota bacterium]
MAQILIIDDEYLTTEMLAAFLDLIGHQATEAHSGQEMWSKLHYMQPDVILLDVMLPDANGLDLCAKLRANAPTARVPIIIISAQAPPLNHEAKDVGADAYLVKPISLQALRDILASVGVTDKRRAARP